MRRINDFSVAMTEVGMWAKVKVLVDDDSFAVEGILGRCSSSYICFASNDGRFNGSNHFGGEWRSIISGYEYGWVICDQHVGDSTFQEIISSHGFDCAYDIRPYAIVKEDGSEVLFDGATLPNPDTSEYAFFNDKYTRDKVYSEIHGYHHHHGITPNNPVEDKRGHKIGVELEVEFNNSSLKRTWNNKAKSNWFYCERDGSLGDTGCEIITVPMLPKDIKDRNTWDKLISYLANKAKSWDSPRCGLHVHIGREILGSNPEQQSETIGKLLYLYHHFLNGTSMNTKIFGRERAYNEKDGKTEEGKAVATLGSEVLKIKGIKDRVKDGMIRKSKTDRYFDINLSNEHTIEFRKGRGSIKTSRIIMVIEYCEIMCKYAKQAKWEEVSKEKFIEYVVGNIKSDSPLYRFFECGERCDSSF